MNRNNKMKFCIGLVGLLLMRGFSYGQTVSVQEYVQKLCGPTAFPEQLVLHMDIQKEKAVRVVIDESLLDKQIRESYESSERIRGEFPTLEVYAAEVRNIQSNQFQKTSQRITTSAQGQHLLEYDSDGEHVAKEVIQFRVDGENWRSLQIDHDRRTASLQKGTKGIFTDYRETGMFGSAGRLLLNLFFRMLPNQSQADAIDSLCKGETLIAGTRSLKLESMEDADPPRLLLTYRDSSEPSSVEFQLDPKNIGVLLGKKSSTPQVSSQWSFIRNANDQGHGFACTQTYIFESREASGRLRERESVVLEGTSSTAEWNIQQLWVDKMAEIKDYQVSVQP